MISAASTDFGRYPQTARLRISILHRYLASITVLTLIGTCALEGPIRLFLVHIHAEAVLYLRDILAVLAVGTFFLTSFRITRVKFGLGVLFFTLVAAALYANSLDTGPKAIAMGMKVFLPVFLGAIFADYLQLGIRRFYWIAVGGLFLTVVGLQWSALRPTPWAGIDYDAAGITVEGTRAWMIDGIDRLAGFARSSGDAANLILLFFTIAVMARRSLINWLPVTAVSAYGLHLTTMRSAFLGLVVVAAIGALIRVRQIGWLIKCGLITAMVGAIAAPWVSQRILGHYLKASGEGLANSGSMVMRIREVWPDLTERFHGAIDFALGLGLGNVGVPQKLFNPLHYNPADNMPLYALAVFGSISLLFHFALAARIVRSFGYARIEAESLFLAMAGLVYSVGLVMNGFESVPLGLAIGFTIGLGLRSQSGDREAYDV